MTLFSRGYEMNYYNEIDPFCAQWLRNLIEAGLITKGDVDERSITDVKPNDLKGYTQCHFFAGIGGWSYALRLAGWPDDKSVWTGSCPCQPFSCAGKKQAEKDLRHLWPEFRRLIKKCKPPVVFGEQVESKAGRLWFNNLRVDLEKLDYAVGGADLCAAGVGAPHRRQRLWFVADAMCNRKIRKFKNKKNTAIAASSTREKRLRDITFITNGCKIGGMEDSIRLGRRGRNVSISKRETRETQTPRPCGMGAWDNATIIPFTDGKQRPIKPSIECLVDGLSFKLADGCTSKSTSRRKLLHGFGNAIVPQVVAEFIGAFMDTLNPKVELKEGK